MNKDVITNTALQSLTKITDFYLSPDASELSPTEASTTTLQNAETKWYEFTADMSDDNMRVVVMRQGKCESAIRVYAVTPVGTAGTASVLTLLDKVGVLDDDQYGSRAVEFRVSGLKGIPIVVRCRDKILFASVKAAN